MVCAESPAHHRFTFNLTQETGLKNAGVDFEGWCRWLCAAAVLMFGLCAAGVAQTATQAPEPKVSVSGFNVTGNTLLPEERIDAELAPFKGERTVDDLKQAAVALQSLYAHAGFGGVVAFLPEQSLAGGVVAITVVEGRLARISTSGQEQFSTDNIRASLPALAAGVTPRLKRIDAQIQLANENPAKKVEVLLQPGQRSGEVDAHIAVTEKPVQRWTIAADNTGNSQTGRLRASVSWQHANLWGRDHVLAAQYLTSPTKPSAVQVISAGYRVPLYEQLAAIDVYAGYSDIDGGNTATVAGDLRFIGRGHLVGARATRYLERVGELDQRIAVGLDHRAYLNQCGIAGLPAGACGPAGESVALQPLSLEYSGQWAGSPRLGFSVSAHHNLQLGGDRSGDARFEAVRAGAKPRYTLLRVSAAAAFDVADAWQVQARLNGQFTSDALVPGEQFGIGGMESVRGYEERELAGDRGVFTSVELLAPPWVNDQALRDGQLRFVAFVDAGQVSNRLGTPCLTTNTSVQTRCTLASVGAGARYERGSFSARLFVASALKPAVRTKDNDIGAHFAVSYSF